MPSPSILSPAVPPPVPQLVDAAYEHPETRALVSLVDEAAELVRTRGEVAFSEFRVPDSRWRHRETYVFVVGLDGTVIVHEDPAIEGRSQLDLEDVAGKPIIRGLLEAATTSPTKSGGWYHYQWPVPGGLYPRWKTSYVRQVPAPSGERYVVGAGVYNDRMERPFVRDAVLQAVALIEERGPAAFARLRDPTGPFIAKDAYVFVLDENGVELVNPAFPSLEGRAILDFKDTQGTPVIREMVALVQTRGAGWIDYMWPKPGASIAMRKSAYVSRAVHGDRTFVVGCGVYLAEAAVEIHPTPRLTAPELIALVRDAATLVAQAGDAAYAAFTAPGSRWFRDDTYVFALAMDGKLVFHAADPARVGSEVERDVLGRPVSTRIVEVATGSGGEGWVHYMYPRPGDIFPAWKSTFAKRVMLPSGAHHVVCCGVYNMQLDSTLIEDLVDRAAMLVAERGRGAFPQLRDRTGPFVFMDTYVFVTRSDGTELVNAAQPALEGRNLRGLRDISGRAVIRDEIEAALRHGRAWLDCYWFRPGENTPTLKHTYVRAVRAGEETVIVGSGLYECE